jgi:hypothetical protein
MASPQVNVVTGECQREGSSTRIAFEKREWRHALQPPIVALVLVPRYSMQRHGADARVLALRARSNAIRHPAQARWIAFEEADETLITKQRRGDVLLIDIVVERVPVASGN